MYTIPIHPIDIIDVKKNNDNMKTLKRTAENQNKKIT